MKNFRFYILLCLLFAVVTMAKAQQWKKLHTGVTDDLYDVCCIDENTIFVCGQNGVILKSTDSGISWEEKYRRTGCRMTEICFADNNVGYAICDTALEDYYSHQWFLVKTYDGGETWNDVGDSFISWIESYSGFDNQFVRAEMFLNDADNLVVAVSFDGIYKSTDGGLTMRRLDNDFTINETRGIFFEDNVGYLLWDDGEEDFMFPGERYPGVAQSEDYGETWTLKENVADITVGISYAHFYDKNHIRLFGEFQISEDDYYGILDTYDGFGSFETVGGGTYYMQFAEEYIRAKFTENGWGISMLWEEDMPGVGRAVAYTEDDGLSWTFYSGYGLPTFRLYDIDGTDTTFYISCAEGNVLKNRQFTLMGMEENALQTVTVYPNPTNDKIIIEGIKPTEVQVYNTLGQLVKTIQNSNEINVSDLPKGIYMLQVKDACGNRRWAKVAVK